MPCFSVPDCIVQNEAAIYYLFIEIWQLLTLLHETKSKILKAVGAKTVAKGVETRNLFFSSNF